MNSNIKITNFDIIYLSIKLQLTTSISMTKIINHQWIPMSDGTRLSAKIWLPVDAEKNPCPAVLEYIPYRKRDFKAMRDAKTFDRFARNGYVGKRVDIRGSGVSQKESSGMNTYNKN